MNIKHRPFILAVSIFALFAGCSTSTKQSSRDTTIVNFTFKQGKPLPANEWHCYNTEQERICIPSAWAVINQDAYLLVANPTDSLSNSYFGVLKHDDSTSEYNPVKYLKELSADLRQDTIGKFVDQKVVKITYNDKVVFYSESHSLINDESFITYSTVFDIDNKVFDISLKVRTAQQQSFKELYKDIIFNFYYKNNLVFTSRDKITNIQVVDPNKL